MSNVQPNIYRAEPNKSNKLEAGIVYSGIMQPNPLLCPIKAMIAVGCNKCILKVGGKGTIKAEPDGASVVLGVVTENVQLENAQNENTGKMSKLIDSLINNGVPREDIRTQTYQIQPQYDFINGEQMFRGYRVVHEIKVEISNLNLAGMIIDEAVIAGANTVGDINFYVSNPQKYYEMAINQALSDAVSKAESVGARMKVYVNPVPLKITEITTPVTAPIPYMSLQAAGAATPIQPGMTEITAVLEVEFVYSCSRAY